MACGDYGSEAYWLADRHYETGVFELLGCVRAFVWTCFGYGNGFVGRTQV